MTRKTHDAELCERIRALEKEVADLKGELELHRLGGSHSTGPTWVVPYYPQTWPTWTRPDTTTWPAGVTEPVITYGNTTRSVEGIQSTYTTGGGMRTV
jgi:hypothetical protein